MRRIFLLLFLFPSVLLAQHNRQELVQPNYDSYNLRFWPKEMTVVQKYDKGNDITFQEVYRFDSVGNLTEYRKQGFGGEKVTHYPLTMEDVSRNKLYVFDYDGDVLEMRQFNLKGELYSTTHCIYAEGGNLVQSIEYTYHADSGMVTRRTVSYYDKRERLKKVDQYTADELLLWSEKRKYDRHGNLEKRTQTFFSDDEKEVTVEKRIYTYDRHRNWTQCLYILNGKQMYTIERKIVYYGE